MDLGKYTEGLTTEEKIYFLNFLIGWLTGMTKREESGQYVKTADIKAGFINARKEVKADSTGL